jgi:uncharacterized protein (UPF0332 family)
VLFNQHIVETGLFPTELSKFIMGSKVMREDADYGDFVEGATKIELRSLSF